MSDPDLEAIRAQRLAQLQTQFKVSKNYFETPTAVTILLSWSNIYESKILLSFLEFLNALNKFLNRKDNINSRNGLTKFINQGGDGGAGQQQQRMEKEKQMEEMRHSILTQVLDQSARARRTYRTLSNLLNVL